MPSYNLSILGQEISFKTDVEEKRVREAIELIEKRFAGLDTYGSRMNKEKLLILVALSLADDSLQKNQKLDYLENRLIELLEKINEFDKNML